MFRRAAMSVATLGVLTACDSSEPVHAPQAFAPRTTLNLELSAASATSGQRVSVALANTAADEIGGVQGFLHYDPSKLQYRGQLREAGSDQIMLVNDKQANRGELRLALLDISGMDRSMPLVFEVIGAGYVSSLSFDIEEAAANGSPVKLLDISVAKSVVINPSLASAASAVRMSVQDWAVVVDGMDDAKQLQLDPGEIRNGLKFGDTNFDGNVTLADALYIINASVGLNELIIGTDGTGPSGDRDAVVAGNVFPFNAPGLGEAGDALPPGLEVNGARLATLGDGVALINEFVGIDQPVVGEIIPGRPTTPASNRIVITGNISTNQTWTNTNIYELSGAVQVTGGATLTIEAGTRVEGQQGTGPGVGGAALFVGRDGMISAVGTPLQPIVMTCVGTKFKGCWGGLTILGNASLNDGALTSPAIASRGTAGGCREKQAEGPAGFLYGGCNDNDNSGTLKYVRIEYAGFRFTPLNELNGLALNGVGRGTTLDYIQVHAGLDDGIEMFGGTVNMQHLVLTANSDDSFDYTEGWNGKAQFVIVQHDSLDSDKAFEQDNYEFALDALPRATPQIYNATLVGKAFVTSTSGTAGNNSVGGLNVRRGTRPKHFNFLVQNFPFALDIDDASTCVDWNTATGFEFKNSIFAANTRLDASDTPDPACEANESAAILLAGSNNSNVATSPLLSPLNVMVPDFRPAFGTATGGATPPADGFFDVTATYIGAVAPANATKSNIPWYSGWTRGWATPATP
ncbi:MAG: hypothetical protein H7Z40_12710 [Phycisphaerae bacterium]|nr:hypothetical protein [Gemmatimonadaceae bacterium]